MLVILASLFNKSMLCLETKSTDLTVYQVEMKECVGCPSTQFKILRKFNGIHSHCYRIFWRMHKSIGQTNLITNKYQNSNQTQITKSLVKNKNNHHKNKTKAELLDLLDAETNIMKGNPIWETKSISAGNDAILLLSSRLYSKTSNQNINTVIKKAEIIREINMEYKKYNID